MFSRTRPAGPAPAVNPDRGPARVRRRGDRSRHESVGARGLAQAAGLLARVVRIVVGIAAAIIVAGILLVVLKANPTNSVVSAVHDTAHTLVGPFDGMFSFHSARAAIAVNWGIAALAYLVVGGLIARLLGGRTRR
jgi:hypothetical protein